MREGSHAPVWLFSFVDLAFLLLIAMTQIDGGGRRVPELGEIVVPRIRTDGAAPLSTDAAERWQLRVLPPEPDPTSPFELVRSPGPDEDAAERLGAPALRERLAALHDEGARVPLLAPHQNSLSKHLLEAVEALENVWPRRRRATVEPLLAAR